MFILHICETDCVPLVQVCTRYLFFYSAVEILEYNILRITTHDALDRTVFFFVRYVIMKPQYYIRFLEINNTKYKHYTPLQKPVPYFKTL